jgi:hypothetical protein
MIRHDSVYVFLDKSPSESWPEIYIFRRFFFYKDPLDLYKIDKEREESNTQRKVVKLNHAYVWSASARW